VGRVGFLNIRTSKILLGLFLLSSLGGEFGNDSRCDSFQGPCNIGNILGNGVEGVITGSRRTAALRSGSKQGVGMGGRRFYLWPVATWGSNRFLLWNVEEESGKDGENDL
jgi:hypothetical protein